MVNDGMRFEFERHAHAPALAWLLVHDAGADVARVVAGAGVREAGAVFWEGVNPCANPEAVTEHHFPLCTGALARGDEIVAFTPGHILDRLFMIRDGARLYLSNTLPFALKAAGARLAPRHIYYHWDFGQITAHSQSAPLERGRLEFFHNTNVVIGRDNSVRIAAKPASPPFSSYAEYMGAMRAYLADVRTQAGGYEPAAMISTGYDSPAAAVLAKEIGATRGFTISNARHGEGDDDSGEAIGARLGYSVVARERDAHRAYGFEAERLFYASALPEDIIFFPFKDDIAGTLLFSGYKGDTMWDANASPVGTWSWDPGGATLQSFRVAANFVHMPPAFFGWRRHADLLAISNSAEMKPWSVGGDYDRPIARRMVEDAGVPRDWFGVAKKAVSATFGVDKDHYLSADDLGVSAEFAQRLAAHRARWSTPALEASMSAANAAHALVRSVHGALYRRAHAKPQKAAPAAPKPRSALKENLAGVVGALSDWRRPYMQPFTNLCFAAQVATEALTADYPTIAGE